MADTIATTAVPSGPTGQSQNPLVSFFPIVVVCGILYLLVLRPQQKQAKEHRAMVDALKPGDRVLTQGGIYGTVASLKGASVIVKIADNVKVELSRTAISQVLTETANGTPAVSPTEIVS